MSSWTVESSWYHLKGWDFKGSIDGKKWDILDSHTNSNVLNGQGLSINFPCKRGLYRYFLIEQTQKGYTETYGFSVRQFEIFGTVYESNYVPKYYNEAICKSFKIDLIFILVLIK